MRNNLQPTSAAVVAFQIAYGYLACHRQTKNWFGRVDTVAARQRDAGAFARGAATLEYAPSHGGRQFFNRPTEHRNGHQRSAAHRVDIADGVHGSDLAEVERVVHDGHKKIRGADDGLAVAEIEHGSVVLGVVADEQPRAGRGLAGDAQNFVQHLGRNFAAATGAVAVLGEANGIGGLSLGRNIKLAERVGIEPTSARSRTDNGFEDRGDHQAPFTLREKF